jgi:urea carboxylase
MWNRHRQTADFRDGRQWLLRFFDQIRFYPVTSEELARLREEFPYGRVRLEVEHTTLRLRDYLRFLEENAASIAAFKARQQAAFEAERERWKEPAVTSGAAEAPEAESASGADGAVPEGCERVSSPVSGSIWQIRVGPGDRVMAGAVLAVIEAMKMEVPIVAEEAAEVVEVRGSPGGAISAGHTLMVIRPQPGGAHAA